MFLPKIRPEKIIPLDKSIASSVLWLGDIISSEIQSKSTKLQLDRSWIMAYYMVRKISYLIHNDMFFSLISTSGKMQADRIASSIIIISFESGLEITGRSKKQISIRSLCETLLGYKSQVILIKNLVDQFRHKEGHSCFSKENIFYLKSKFSWPDEMKAYRGERDKDNCCCPPRCPFLSNELTTVENFIRIFTSPHRGMTPSLTGRLGSKLAKKTPVPDLWKENYKKFEIDTCLNFIKDPDPGFGFKNKWTKIEKFSIQYE